MRSMYLDFPGMSKEDEIAEIARVQKARRKGRAALEKKMDELCPVSDKHNYAARKEKLDVTRHVLRLMEESTLDHLWPDLSSKRPDQKERMADVLGEQILIMKDMLHTRYMELEAWKLEFETDSNDAKRASEVTDAKVGEAREKATEENITIPAGKAADSGTFVLIPVLKQLENDFSEISKEDEDFIQNAKSEDRRRTLRELIERRLGQITATKKGRAY